MIHPIPPGFYCVPSTLLALTGEDWSSVVMPALNRAMHSDTLLGPVGSSYVRCAETVLRELQYNVRLYRKPDLRAKLSTWAERSHDRYPGRALMVAVRGHLLTVQDGRIYDTFTPHGERDARNHAYGHALVNYASLVEKAQRA